VPVEELVAVVAVALTVVFAWPQVFRALRHGVDGVSVGAITQSMVAASAWLGYGIARGLAPVIVANLGVMTGQLVVTLELTRLRALTRPRSAAAIAAAVALIGLSQVGVLTDPIVAIAGLVACTSVVTQLLEVRREPHKLEGLSAGTYAILTGVSASWATYGLLEADVVIVATNVVVLPMAAYITWAASRSHHELEVEQPQGDQCQAEDRPAA
jgi:uncharacterized protein with PQ loop repeat